MSLDRNQSIRVRGSVRGRSHALRWLLVFVLFFWIRHWRESVSWQDSDPEHCMTSLLPAVNTSFYFRRISESVSENTYVWLQNPPGRLWDLGLQVNLAWPDHVKGEQWGEVTYFSFSFYLILPSRRLHPAVAVWASRCCSHAASAEHLYTVAASRKEGSNSTSGRWREIRPQRIVVSGKCFVWEIFLVVGIQMGKMPTRVGSQDVQTSNTKQNSVVHAQTVKGDPEGTVRKV